MSETIRALGYRVVWAFDVDYEKAPSVHIDTDDFVLDLSGRELRATLKREYPTIDQARTMVEDYLRGWELIIGISEHPEAVHFEYERAEIDEDEIDPETGHRVRLAKAHVETSVSLSAVLRASRGQYPLPAEAFRVDSVVEAMYSRYSRYQARRELLTSMAYFCLTVLEQSVGGKRNLRGRERREETARTYGIAGGILTRLAVLCSEKGSDVEARKAPHGLAFIPLSEPERRWVLAAVRLLIRRAGEFAACPDKQLAEITSQDLPSLGDSA